MFLSFFRKKLVFKDKPFRNEGIQNITVDKDELRDIVFDLIRTIKDPEKPQTLEELNVVYEDGVDVRNSLCGHVSVVRIEFNPTVPHCSLATLIGLCIRVKLERNVPYPFKLDIFIKEGAHTTEEESHNLDENELTLLNTKFERTKCIPRLYMNVSVNKQINDKERISAAMENPNLKEVVEQCIKDED